MKLKSYFSATVEAAMVLARKELGEDALLVNARPATPETRYLGAYEVVFGVLPEQPHAPVLAAPAVGATGDDPVRSELADLRRQIERLALATGENMSTPNRSTTAQIDQQSDELHPNLVDQLEKGVRLEQLFRVDTQLGRRDASRSIVALVGPPGAGKTTTLVKLAARYGLARRRPTHILTADVHRIAAVDQLRALAALLGVTCEVAETPLILSQQLEEQRSKELVLIDTPGFAFREMGDASELATFLACHEEIETHLVLPASMKAGDLSRVCDSYAIFQPAKLLFTRIDETACYGALVSEASRLNLPVSFLCTGQQIPDDLEEATLRRLTDLVLGDERGLRPMLRMGASA